MAEMIFNNGPHYSEEHNCIYYTNQTDNSPSSHFVVWGVLDPTKKLVVPKTLSGNLDCYEICDTRTYIKTTTGPNSEIWTYSITNKREIELVEIKDGCNAMIGQSAFANNSNLKIIYIPTSISIINDSAFEKCKEAIIYYGGDYDSLATKFVGAPYPLPIESQVSRINYNKNPFTGEGEGDQDFDYSFQEGPYFYKIISEDNREIALVKYLKKYDEMLEYTSIPQGWRVNEIGNSYFIAKISNGAFSDLYLDYLKIDYSNLDYAFPVIEAKAFENSIIEHLDIIQHSVIDDQIGQYIPAKNITINCGYYDTVIIKANAFENNENLQTIIFENMHQLIIENSAFTNSSLEAVEFFFRQGFQDSIQFPGDWGENNPFINIGEYAFENSELKNISFPEISEQIYELIYDEFEGEIGLLFLNPGCFQNTQIEHLDLSNTFLLSVPSSFFKEENIIKSVVFPKTLTRIDGCAFDRCESLTKIIMGKNKYKTINICDNFISYDDNPPSKKPLFIFKGKPTDLEIVDDNNEYVGEFRPWITVIFANLSVKIKHNNTLKDIYKIYTKTINALKEIDYFTYKPNKEENK